MEEIVELVSNVINQNLAINYFFDFIANTI